MYAGEIALNMTTTSQSVISGMLDGYCYPVAIQPHVLHIHAWHVLPSQGWSKHLFHGGEYKDRETDYTQPPPRIASDYCHYFASMPLDSCRPKHTQEARNEEATPIE